MSVRSDDEVIADRMAAWWAVTRALLGEVTPGLIKVQMRILDGRVEVRFVYDPAVGVDPRSRADAEQTVERVRATVDAVVAVPTVLDLAYVDETAENERSRAALEEWGPRSAVTVFRRGPALWMRDV